MQPTVKRIDVLVCYDVQTTTKAGERRLRRVGKLCKNYGQRVQYSMFACRVTRDQYEALEARLCDLIDEATDCLHLYTLPGGREACLTRYGVSRYTDFDQPLIL